MIELQRLTIQRQRRVAQALGEAEKDTAFVKTVHKEVRPILAEAVKAGAALDLGTELPPLVLDNSADVVFSSFQRFLAAVERGMTDRVIAPLPPEQAKKKAAAALLSRRAFPNGIGFLSSSMPLQYDAMVNVIDLLRNDTACAAAVKELGTGFFVDHMEAHLKLYGRAVRSGDDRDLEAVGTAFHAAYTRLVVKIAAYQEDDAAVQQRLYNPYQKELEAQRADERQARQRRAKKKAAKAAPTP